MLQAHIGCEGVSLTLCQAFLKGFKDSTSAECGVSDKWLLGSGLSLGFKSAYIAQATPESDLDRLGFRIACLVSYSASRPPSLE